LKIEIGKLKIADSFNAELRIKYKRDVILSEAKNLKRQLFDRKNINMESD
jgi:hypothetical protein